MPTRAPRARTASAISVAVAQQSCSASTETTSSRAAPRRRPEAARAASVCSSQRATLQMITVLTIIAKVLSPFHYAFVQRGAWEVLLLSGAAGLIGTWIVLRGLAFYAHAIGTAAFPGLVVADGLAFSPLLGAFGAAAVFALAVAALGRRSRGDDGSFTALTLVGALALGVILASNVFHSETNVETLLFGSLLLVGGQDLVVAALTTVAVVVLSAVLGRRWLAVGFDARNARSLGARSSLSELVLLALVAVSVVAALSTLGALLVSALLVVPAATARLWTTTLRSWQLASVALAAVEGIVGLWVSVEANVPPGAAIAVLAGGAFAIAAVPRAPPAARPSPCTRSSSRTPTRTSTSRGPPTSRRRRTRRSCSRTATSSTTGCARSYRRRAAIRRWSTSGRRCRSSSARIRTGGTIRETPKRPSLQSATRSHAHSRNSGRASSATRRPTSRSCARSTERSRNASRTCRRRTGSSSPTTTHSRTSRSATASRSSAPSSRRRQPRRSLPRATRRS